MSKRKNSVIGIPLKVIVRFIIAFTVFGIGAYIVKFYIESEIYKLFFSVILAVVIMMIGIPKDKWKELFEK
ncbi:hypothetical protein SA58113_p20027 (plasmid) [Staphylococcus argenteus]|uniref:hypothetical protein n=1 Tax=Staphylococcus argenteus TaxID=985002 RepID=UPI000E32DB95|nr:hypothetical protein [Staphylococcus argenteus]BBD87471.1 hypothetical protein SA58113_p20027 [Staphylococcus argenteus]